MLITFARGNTYTRAMDDIQGNRMVPDDQGRERLLGARLFRATAQFVKVCGFEQTVVDDPAKISTNLMNVVFCFTQDA
jgi:hypothetical protein